MTHKQLWLAWQEWRVTGDPKNPPSEVWELYNREKRRCYEAADTSEEGERQVVRLIEEMGI